MSVVHSLLIKSQYKKPMVRVDTIQVNQNGIERNVPCPPLRQVLLLEERTLDEFNLQPGDLRENMIIKDLDLYVLPSGTVLQIGDTRIGLTFHCEPCKIIADKVNLKDIRDQRGYLGRFLNDGVMTVGDNVAVTSDRIETISDVPVERIKWYLTKINEPISASNLMWQVGLASSYCRALPAMIRKHPDIDARKVLFKNHS